MASEIKLTIDGCEVTVDKGQTILKAADKLGIVIPTFCWDPRLIPIGACRMCLVEVEKSPKLVPACATPVADGMVVNVYSEKAVKARKDVLEFQLVNHPLDCPTCDKGGECELQDLTFDHGPTETRTVEPRNRKIFDKQYKYDDIPLGPVIWHNANRCIQCYKCTRIIKEIAGDDDLGAFNRGFRVIIHRHKHKPFRSQFSGNTVEYCPVGALISNSFLYRERTWMLDKTPSVCHLCGDGCNTTLWHKGQKLFRVYSRWNDHVDDGLICDRGRFGALYADSDRRLKNPKIRKDGKLVDVGWTEALDFITENIKSVRAKSGSDSIGIIGNEMLSNEEAYLLSRFARQVIGTNNIDFRFEDRFTPSTNFYFKLLGIVSRRIPYAAFDKFENILSIGTDLEVQHPVLSLWIKKAIYSGKSTCYAAYHKHIDFTLHPVESIEYFPQGEYNFLLTLYHALRGEDYSDLATNAGVRIEDVRRWTESIKTGRTLILAGEDLYNNPHGSVNIDIVKAICGVLGDESGINILFDGSNYIGNVLCGTTPGILPMGLENNHDNRVQLAGKWQVEKLADEDGLDTNSILSNGVEGKLGALLMFGADPVGFYPDRDLVIKALNNTGFKISCETFLSETGKMCDAVLPMAAFPENEGSMISTEGRLQHFQKAFDTAFSSAEGWRIILRLSQKLGFEKDYTGPAEIWAEMTELSETFANITYRGIESRGLLLNLDFNDKDHVDINELAVADLPKPLDNFPLILTYGNSIYQKRFLTYYAESMDKIDPGPRLYIHPDNAEKMKLHNNDTVRISSEYGNLTMKLTTDSHIRPGTVFIPVNFIEAEVNSLLSSDSALTFVKVEKL